MRFSLSRHCALKHLEKPSVYALLTDELYELDEEAFGLLMSCASADGYEAPESDFARYCLKEGILVKGKVQVARPPVEKSPEPSLRYLELQITKRCNLRCKHCYIGPPGPVDLSLEDIGLALEEFEKMQGLRVLITGGEPLLHRQFADINALLPRFALRKVLFTNGVLMDGATLRALNVDEIQVSVDGLEHAHEAIRGKGTYKKAMKCVESALIQGIDVSVSTMVNPANLDDFDYMERAFRALGIRDWTVDVPCAVGNLRENPALQLGPVEAGRYLRYGFGDSLHEGGEGFACGLHLMSVMADGVCAKCAFYAETPAGHLSEGLGRCWERIEPVRLDALSCDCGEVDSCRGGCRFRATLLGSPFGKDLYRCSRYDKM